MKFIHTAFLVSSKDNADRFYGKLLGLELLREYEVGKELMYSLFGIGTDYPVRLYGTDDIQFEVFIASEKVPSPVIAHTCIQVEDRESLANRAKEMDFKVIVVAREGKPDLIFIHDRDGNSFEIK